MRTIRLPLIVLLIIVVAAVAIWSARRPLTEAAVARWFDAQGVEARYRITALSPGAVTLEQLRLGPGARPDLTVERVDATVAWGLWQPRIATMRLISPELRATVSRQGVSFGSLDRLLPARSEPARKFPEIDVTIVGGNLRVATPAGAFAGRVDGSGRLDGGFRGRWQIAPTTLVVSGCAVAPRAMITLATAPEGVRVTAAGILPRVDCPRWTAAAIDWRAAATLPQSLDRYAATFEARAARLNADGYDAQALQLRGDAKASSLKGPVTGSARVEADEFRGPPLAAGRIVAAGPYRFDASTGLGSASAALTVSDARATLTTAATRTLSQQLAGTLAQPLFDAIMARGAAAAVSFDADASLAIDRETGGLKLELSALTARARTGARLRQTGTVTFASGGIALAGGATVSGGGLPSLMLNGTGSGRGGRIEGVAALTAGQWTVPGATLHRLNVEARGNAGRTTLTGLARASGPLGGGVVARQLGMPIELEIDPAGTIAVGPRCLSIGWAALARDTLALGPGAARICPTGNAIARLAGTRLSGGGFIAPLRLHGRTGDVPVSIASPRLDLGLSGTTGRPRLAFAPAQIAVRYGETQAAATLSGVFDVAAASGAGVLAGARLDVPGAPVTIAAAGGRWRLADGRFELAAGMARVTDRTAPARFEPLRIDGVSALLSRGIVEARGTGRLAATGARLFDFTTTHAVASGRGTASVETGTLRFGPDLQPYQITEALRGVVETVAGPVNGSGRFTWVGTDIDSHGTLLVDHVSLATAALGPVDDVAGTLVFDDLLALTTPPGQQLTVKRINPGVAVDDGAVRFQTLGPDAAAIESIVWPYAGGTLTLAPVTIRAGDATRSFLLTVAGLDAEQFLQKFEIKNLNVTGRFDGRLPLVFADGKGRIAGGTLVAREGGGLVQYVGEVGGEDLGAGARLAFDALRRLRYRSLALDLDGDLDGELVTQLRFAGTNEATTTLGGGPLPIRATGLPFRFNVTVRAPFRALLGTASSLSDVRPLFRPPAAVQPR